MGDESFFDMVCLNYIDEALPEDFNIGYSHMRWPFIVVPCIALTLNLFIIVTHIRKRFQYRKLNSRVQSSSIESMLYILTVVETLMSLYWLVNGIFFYEVKVISQNCSACFFTSIFFIFIQAFDWVFFTCSLHNIMCFMRDPMKEQGFPFRLKIYAIISAAISGLFTYCVFATGTYGLSPMLTCFIRNNFKDPSKDVAVYSIMLFPLIYVIYSITSFVRVFRHRNFKGHSEFKLATIKYMIYSLLYIVFYFPSILLYLLSINQNIPKETYLSWFSYFCSLATISINLVLCVFRILEGYVKCHWKALLVHQELDESLMTDSAAEEEEEPNYNLNKSDTKIEINEIGNLARRRNSSSRVRRLSSWNKIAIDMIKGFMKNFFIGLVLAFDKSRTINVERTMKSKYYTEENAYVFDSESSTSDEQLYIEVIEYAPKVFKRIRDCEGITEDEIIESLNPLNNTTIIQSQGRSSSFFISTDDSKLILKTLKKEEFDNIFNKFLLFYLQYIENNKDSLTCRIYGIYSVKVARDADPLLIILMRDAKGPFKNYITTTYDLKGSLHNRETNLCEDSLADPFLARKDLNFLKDEKFLNLENRKAFLENATFDSEFFEDLNLMDYSLLLLKIELNETTFEDFLKFKLSIDYKYYQKHIYFSIDNPNVAFVCVIIDYLQDFSFLKKMENNIKNFITERPTKSDLISCVPADVYSKRFIEFLQKITKIN